MTMRNPLIDRERTTPVAETFDPAKRYRYTWPGQPQKVISGSELNELLKGADPSQLAIEEATELPSLAPSPPPAAPPSRNSRNEP